jgi:hypothetical protein
MKNSLHLFDSIFHKGHNGKVKFILTGSAGDYNITYKSNPEFAEQVPHARKSWRHSFSAKEGDYVYFSAQANERGAEVKVKILFNGKVFKQAVASGDFAIAYTGGCLC